MGAINEESNYQLVTVKKGMFVLHGLKDEKTGADDSEFASLEVHGLESFEPAETDKGEMLVFKFYDVDHLSGELNYFHVWLGERDAIDLMTRLAQLDGVKDQQMRLRAYYKEGAGRGISVRVPKGDKWELLSADKETRKALNLPEWLAPKTKGNKTAFYDSSECYEFLKSLLVQKIVVSFE